MASRRKRTKYHHVEDGEWFQPALSKPNKEQCCDCGLVHRVEYRKIEGKVQWKASVDARATAAARRVFKYRSKE